MSDNDDEIFLFENVVKHLVSTYECSNDAAIRMVNEYYKKFTDPEYCSKFDISTQNEEFFSHIAARGMTDRVYYYTELNNKPNEEKFIIWQRSVRGVENL